MNIVKFLFLIVSCNLISNYASPQPVTDSAHKATRPYKQIKFDDLIKQKAEVDSGLINIYKQDGRYYFEISNTILNKDILLVSRIVKGGAETRDPLTGAGYAGDEINELVVKFEKGPGNKMFLKRVSFSEYSKDTTRQMYLSVRNSNFQPIVAAFDCKALSKKGDGALIDMTDYVNGDNDVLFFNPTIKSGLQLGGIQADKSYIETINSYPLNTEIRTVKTFGKNVNISVFSGPASSSTASFELNTSLVLLPEKPMQPRFNDARVGYFSVGYTDFDINQQGVEKVTMIKRWKLEPKAEDIEKYKRGELVEPQKPIIFYIDPATPRKWLPFLIQGVNDWQVAFEQAGFKNAIYAKEPPTRKEDSTWSIEDARFSAIVYKASSIANANGPTITDPRSGEILESHINWYHNVMQLLHDWYMIQAGPSDTLARKMQFDDELMGQLIRFVCSHEVGHTLGLLHNFGASSTVPVDSLRNKNWVEKHGHTPSIMDYARFNYIAQPGDQVSEKGLFPRIGDYDKWAIEWGYRIFTQYKTGEDEKSYLNDWVIGKQKDNRLWFGTEKNLFDPRSQNEDLGDDAMKAGTYGIKNLQYILPKLQDWTKMPNDNYSGLRRVYKMTINQYNLYLGHAAKNIGGEFYSPKTVEQDGVVYSIVSKETQKKAVAFLMKELFITPKWLIDISILEKIGDDPIVIAGNLQGKYLDKLLSNQLLTNLISHEAIEGNKTYTTIELFADLKKGIWPELKTYHAIDVYRRNLQKRYIALLEKLVLGNTSPGEPVNIDPSSENIIFSVSNPLLSDISSIALAQLMDFQHEIKIAIPLIKDAKSSYHLKDVLQRINKIVKKHEN